MSEVWRDVVGYEGLYQVSNLGNVKSLGNGGTHKVGKMLSQKTTKFGYKTVVLSKQGERSEWRVHRLVALMFIPNEHNYPIINHKDCDKSNNRVENLEWCTYAHNTIHSYENHLQIPPTGENHWNCKLSDEDVRQIKREYIKYDSVFGSIGLFKKYGVGSRTIRDIVSGRRRKGVLV